MQWTKSGSTAAVTLSVLLAMLALTSAPSYDDKQEADEKEAEPVPSTVQGSAAVGSGSASSAKRTPTAVEVRRAWEEGVGHSGYSLLDFATNSAWWSFVCVNGGFSAVDRELAKAHQEPNVPPSNEVLITYDGIQDRWQFKTCILVESVF